MPSQLPPHIYLEREIGRGAHSRVFHARWHDRPCALKVPVGRAKWMRWIYREAVALARVRDPRLPRVFEVGEADGVPFLAMELVHGKTLAAELADGPLSEDRARHVAEQIALALRSVHGAGLIHRDVSPRNVVLEPDERIRLIDFGFATTIEKASTSVGTTGYQAPEQLRAPVRIDARADLYSLGAVFFHCLTGRLPTELETKERKARFQTLEQVTTAPVAHIAARLLEPDPDARAATAHAVVMALHERDEQALTTADPTSWEASSTPFVGRAAELARAVHAGRLAAAGEGRVVLLRGGQGSGKSRFVAQLASLCRKERSHAVVVVPSHPRDPPLAGLRRLVASWLPLSERGGTDGAAQDAMARLLKNETFGPVAALLAPHADAVETGEGRALPASTFAEGAAEVLVRLARASGPSLIAIDDMQWTDAASFEALVRFAHRMHEVPCLLVLARRDEPRSEPRDLDRALRGVRSIGIELGPMSAREQYDLVAGHLGIAELPKPLHSHITSMAPPTPLGVLSLLWSFLDAGALAPYDGDWKLDPTSAASVELPEGALPWVARRIDELAPAAHRVLEVAALLGRSFSSKRLANVLELAADDVGFALAEASRAGLIELESTPRFRFVHDSVREVLASSISRDQARQWHLQIAQTLELTGGRGLAKLCEIADHYAQCDDSEHPHAAFRAARRAAHASFSSYDPEAARRYLEQAREVAARHALELDVAFYRDAGEVELSSGHFDASLDAFGQALQLSTSRTDKAFLYGRIAWIHRARAEPEAAWDALQNAFETLGSAMPTEQAGDLTRSLGEIALHAVGRWRPASLLRPARPQNELEVLCDLHYQNARLGYEYGKPLRMVQSAMATLELTGRLGPSGTRARALAMVGFLWTMAGRHQAGRDRLDEAEAMATELNDPTTYAFCIQLRGLARCWSGELAEALVAIDACIASAGHWLELEELCINTFNGCLILAMRGDAEASWRWLGRAVSRARRSSHRGDVFLPYFVHRIRAAMASQGRASSPDPWLRSAIEIVPADELGKGFLRLLSWGPRARTVLEQGDWDEPLESLVRSFEREGHHPRKSHPVLAEYYAAVAHARLERCWRASPSELPERLAALERAAKDLRIAAKLPLFRAHVACIDAAAAALSARDDIAKEHMRRAEELAAEESCAWVTWTCARIRAISYRRQGAQGAEQDQATIAFALARRHGALAQAERIRAQFELPAEPLSSPAEGSSSVHTARHQLTATLQLVSAEQRSPTQQAELILDQVISELDASRAIVGFEPEPDHDDAVWLIRTRAGQTFVHEDDPALSALQRLIEEDPESGANADDFAVRRARTMTDLEYEPGFVMLEPLRLYDRRVGGLIVERGRSAVAFDADDAEALTVFAHQIPIALEVGRLLREREQLQLSLQQAQKMEAVGQLAGSVAHDFNNMLAAIIASLESASQLTTDPSLLEDLATARDATTRATELTRQLLRFSRQRAFSAERVRLHTVLEDLRRMATTLCGREVTVGFDFGASNDRVTLDPSSLEQALINLLVNARDAIGGPGHVTIRTRDLGPPGEPSSGWLCLEVEDDGCGMTPETLQRIYEPFFSTKAVGVGTGLGLATVYAFVNASKGRIEVTSAPGKGTRFQLFFPHSADRRPLRAARKKQQGSTRPSARQSVLVVDDEILVARAVRRMLEGEGYRVHVAQSAAEALELLTSTESTIELGLFDINMPDTSGEELAYQIRQAGHPMRIAFMSGFVPDAPQLQPLDDTNFIQKPFDAARLSDLLARLAPASARGSNR